MNSPLAVHYLTSPHLRLLLPTIGSFKHNSVAGRLLYPSCALLYLLHCFYRASSIVLLSLAFVITGLTHTAFVQTRSTHTLVPRQSELRKTSLLLSVVVPLKARPSLLLVLGALNSGRARCNLGKTPLAPRNRTWTRDLHQSQLASPQSRLQSSSQTRMTLHFCSLRHLAVCSSLYWLQVFDHDQTLIIIELVSDAESNAKAFCTPESPSYPCKNKMPDGFITAAALARANDNSWIQVTLASISLAGLSGLQYILPRSLVVSIRKSFTWTLVIPVDNLTCASRTGPSVLLAGKEQVLLSCALSLGFILSR